MSVRQLPDDDDDSGGSRPSLTTLLTDLSTIGFLVVTIACAVIVGLTGSVHAFRFGVLTGLLAVFGSNEW